MADVPLDPSPQYTLCDRPKTILKVVWQDQKDRIEAGKFSGELADIDDNIATRLITQPSTVYEKLEDAKRALSATP